MSRYRNYRRHSGSYRRKSGVGNVLIWCLVIFLVISIFPVLFSLGSPGDRDPTQPPASVTDPPELTDPAVDPTDPPVDSPDPTEPVVEPDEPTEPEPTEPVVDPTDPPEPVTESGYLLYQLDADGQKFYLNIEDNDTGASLVSDSSDACLYRWDTTWQTFVVADPAVNRFLVYSVEYDEFYTYEMNEEARFAQFMELDGTVVSGFECPLLGWPHPYYLVRGSVYYSGVVSGGQPVGAYGSSAAAEVYVEYVTREVVSNE